MASKGTASARWARSRRTWAAASVRLRQGQPQALPVRRRRGRPRSFADNGSPHTLAGQAQAGRWAPSAGGATVDGAAHAGAVPGRARDARLRFRARPTTSAGRHREHRLHGACVEVGRARTRPDAAPNQLSFPSAHTSTAASRWPSVFDSHYGHKRLAFRLRRRGRSAYRGWRQQAPPERRAGGRDPGLHSSDTRSRSRTACLDHGREARFSVMPATDAQGTGMGAGFSFSW